MPRAMINGVDHWYDEAGNGEAIIFHHGYTGSHDAWDEIVPEVAKRYRCVRMDGSGAGDTAHPPTGHTIEQFAHDVVRMADHLGLDKFTYVGHSMGGVIGMELGIQYSHRLTRLVLVAPAPADGIVPNPAMAGYRERVLRLRAEGKIDQLVREALHMSPGSNYEGVQRRLERGWATSAAHVEVAEVCDGFEQRRLPGAVLAHKEGDRLI